jgi:hypothetical protein
MADALNSWLNPQVLKTEGAWRFTQEWVDWRKTCSRSGREIDRTATESDSDMFVGETHAPKLTINVKFLR